MQKGGRGKREEGDGHEQLTLNRNAFKTYKSVLKLAAPIEALSHGGGEALLNNVCDSVRIRWVGRRCERTRDFGEERTPSGGIREVDHFRRYCCRDKTGRDSHIPSFVSGDGIIRRACGEIWVSHQTLATHERLLCRLEAPASWSVNHPHDTITANAYHEICAYSDERG